MSGALTLPPSADPAPIHALPGNTGLRQLLSWYEPWRISRGGLILVIAAHLLLFWAFLQTRSTVEAPRAAPVLSVSLIAPKVEVAPPHIEPAPPTPSKPHTPPRKNPPKVLASSTPATADTVLLAPPPVEAEPSPPAAVQPAAPEPGPAPLPQPPRFDAAYLDNPSPVYPRLSRRMGEQGKTLLLVQVSAEGKALKIDIQKSSGSPRLDQAAIEAVRLWRFVPARLGEAKIAASVIVPIIFSLQN